jgi:hypothetical protein
MVQHPQGDSPGMIKFEQPPTSIDRECQKVDISLVGELAAFVAHGLSIQD